LIQRAVVHGIAAVMEPASAWWSDCGGCFVRMTLPDNRRPTRRIFPVRQGHSHEKRPRGERCRRR
jgi:hypothetical protein